MRWLLFLSAVLLLTLQPRATAAPQEAVVETNQTFDEWLSDLIVEAKSRGVDDKLIGETLAGLQPLARVILSDRSQAELNPGFSRYLSARLTQGNISRGRALADTHAALLGRIEREFGVQRRFILAIWGLETSYGRVTGNIPIFRALATLAWEPRRAAFFRGQLFDALSMVEQGHIESKVMTGSWAGAMGQPQFMPSSYLKFAVDFDGDGRRDIWGSVPDALASIANYLRGHGWNGDQTWGREVRVSDAVQARIAELPRRSAGCSAIRSMTERMPLADWQSLGVRLADGSALPNADIPAGLVDVGERKFLVYPNYDAILGYNCAHYYALTVALLAERLRT